MRLIAHYDAKAGKTVLDAEVAGQRTLITNGWGKYDLEEPVIGAVFDGVRLVPAP